MGEKGGETMKKNKRNRALAIGLTAGLLFTLTQPFLHSQASLSVTDYQKKMLVDINFDQNNFKDNVTGLTLGTIPTGSTFEGAIKYNGYRPYGNKGVSTTIEKLNATSEDVLTVSFWMKADQSGGRGIIPFSIGNYTLYQLENRFGFNTFNHDVYGVDFPRDGQWKHITAVFHKGDINKNKLYINGEKQVLTHSSAPLSSVQNHAVTSWTDTSPIVLGGHGNYPLNEQSMIDEMQLYKGTMSDDDARSLYTMSRVPEFNVYQESNRAKLDWSVSTFNPNPFYKTSFESGEDMPIYRTSDTISLSSPISYNGANSIQFKETTNERGNAYFYPQTTSNRSYVYFNDRKYVPNGANVSVSMKVKASKDTLIQPRGIGGVASATIDWHQIYGGNPKVFLEDAPAGSKVIRVSNADEIPIRQGIWVATRYIPEPRHTAPFYMYSEIDRVDVATSTVYLKRALDEDFKAGQVLQGHRHVNPIEFGTQRITGNGEWTNINVNATVRDYDYYDAMQRGFSLHVYVETDGVVQIDDLELVEAQKVEVYRDDNLVYSGYGSQLVDSKATDKASPNKPSLGKVEMTHDVGKVTLLKPSDNGTAYTYKMRSTTSDGTQTLFTENKEVNILSGIKGYSYVADDEPSTVPSGSIRTTNETFTLSESEKKKSYLHVRAIDHAGNVSETLHLRISSPTLTAAPDKTGMYAELDWKMTLDGEMYEYKVFKRRKGESEFQTVSTFDESSGTQLRTLLVYPTKGCGNSDIPNVTFTDSKGNVVTTPKSASLEQWMEEPNAEHQKGYGMGMIEVESMTGTAFNLNPRSHLVDENGDYKYDNIVFGIWDCHGLDNLSDEGYQEVEKFIQDGRGVILGHDTVFYDSRRRNYLKIGQEYGNISMMPSGYTRQFRSTDIEITRDGILTRYPWNLGGVGTKLKVPLTHTSYQKYTGDTWMRWSLPPITGQTQEEYEETNVFLHSWNNIAMIQSGHSNGEATPDEQKILANTLFYLSQKTTDTHLKDYSSIDDMAPDKVGEMEIELAERGQFRSTFAPVKDNGTTYEYYVEAIGMKTGSKYVSDIVEATIQSGVKGYSAEVSASSTPNRSNGETIEPSLTFQPPYRGQFYVHIKSVDKAGNQSVHTMKYDSQVAELIVEPVDEKWTNGQLELRIRSNQALGKVVNIRLPDGQIVPGDMASYVVQENGLYLFYGQDVFGQWVVGSYLVNQIDKADPVVDVYGIPSSWTNRDVEVNIQSK